MHRVFIISVIVAILIGGAAIAYLWSCFRRFEWMPRRAIWRNLFAALPIVALAGWWMLSLDGLVAIIHLAVFWLLSDVLCRVFRINLRRRYYAGYAAVIVTVICLGYAHFAFERIVRTNYTISTGKRLGKNVLRIALISDVHIGRTSGPDRMDACLEAIQSEKPDILVIAGDLIDDDTPADGFEHFVRSLSKLDIPLGKYMAFGNHDTGYRRLRKISIDALVENLEGAGVRILRDETVVLCGCNVEITGRLDRNCRTRKKASELLRQSGRGAYRILIDHQPADYAAEEAAGADLVLSGHFHGGQLWPLGFLMKRARNYRHIYGVMRHGKTDFIITSGISDWAIKFRTGCRSEFVIIDILGAGESKKNSSGGMIRRIRRVSPRLVAA